MDGGKYPLWERVQHLAGEHHARAGLDDIARKVANMQECDYAPGYDCLYDSHWAAGQPSNDATSVVSI